MADIFTYKLYYRYVKGVRVVKPLNYVPYIKEEAMQELVDRFGWQTLRAQALRVALHAVLRGLLAADEVRLRQAPRALLEPDPHEADDARRGAGADRASRPTTTQTIAQDFEYVATKLDITVDELQRSWHGPNKSYRDYATSMPLTRLRSEASACRQLRPCGVQRADHPMITIVDYGLGNILAFSQRVQAAQHRGPPARRPPSSRTRRKLILPGVGAFDHAMELLNALRHARHARRAACWRKRVPVLGVCVGMQMLARASDEGELSRASAGSSGAGARLRRSCGLLGTLPLPHMGWNDVRPAADARLFASLEPDARFYFLHSYYFECAEARRRRSRVASYGADFACAVQRRQHLRRAVPSRRRATTSGTRLLKNFAEL